MSYALNAAMKPMSAAAVATTVWTATTAAKIRVAVSIRKITSVVIYASDGAITTGAGDAGGICSKGDF